MTTLSIGCGLSLPATTTPSSSVTVKAFAYPNKNYVTAIELLIDGVLVVRVNNPPVEMGVPDIAYVTSFPAGTHIAMVKVYDATTFSFVATMAKIVSQ
jgi:hypothetical protein